MNKQERRAQALKKSKQRRIIAAAVCVLAAITIAAIIITNAYQQSKTRIYTDGHQTITLQHNGKFTAALAHEAESGTYTETSNDGIITVTFTTDENSVTGTIVDDTLNLPEEWDDGHGHGSTLMLK